MPVVPLGPNLLNGDELGASGPLAPSLAKRVLVDDLDIAVPKCGSGDLGDEGLAATLRALDEQGVANLHAGVLDEEAQPVEHGLHILRLLDEVVKVIGDEFLRVSGMGGVAVAVVTEVGVDVNLATVLRVGVIRVDGVVEVVVGGLALEVVEDVVGGLVEGRVEGEVGDLATDG